MGKFNFTQELLEDYYENRFQDDVRTFFDIKKKGGIEVADGFRMQIFRVFHRGFLLLGQPDPVHRPQGAAVEEIMFIAMTSVMHETEHYIARMSPKEVRNEAAACFNAFGYPWLNDNLIMHDLHYFLELFEIKSDLYRVDEIEAIRDAMKLVLPFMFDKLIPFLRTWKGSDAFKQYSRATGIRYLIEGLIEENMTVFYRSSYYHHKGLLGMEITHRDFDEYYHGRFLEQMKQYFGGAREKDGYLQIIYLPYHNNHRWEDGNPAGNLKENLLFAAFFLYMTLAEQSFIENAKELERDYYKATGWPMIYSGPGAGPFLHPLYMLDYAGLMPNKSEALLLLEVVRKVFPYLRQEMNAFLNGRTSVMKDVETGQRLIEAIKGKKRAVIRRYLTDGEKQIQELLARWPQSPIGRCQSFLEAEGTHYYIPMK